MALRLKRELGRPKLDRVRGMLVAHAGLVVHAGLADGPAVLGALVTRLTI